MDEKVFSGHVKEMERRLYRVAYAILGRDADCADAAPAPAPSPEADYILPVSERELIHKAKEALVAYGLTTPEELNVASNWQVTMGWQTDIKGDVPNVRGEGRGGDEVRSGSR